MTFRIRRIAALALVALLGAMSSSAQVSIPNTLVAATTIRASDLNTNFSTLGNHALDRLTGGTISGNITADPGITIDGVDIGATVCATCAPTFKDLTLASPATGLTIATHVVVDSSGNIAAAYLTGTIPALTGVNLTNLNASNLASGTVAIARIGTGSPSALNYLRGDGAWSVIAATTAKSATYSAVAGDFVLATGTFTVTLPAAASNTNAEINVKNVSTGVITIGRTGADTIDGATSQSLATQYQSMTLVSDGTNWWIK